MSTALLSSLLAQTYTAPSTGFNVTAYVVGIMIGLVLTSLLGGLMFYGILEKGGQPGWAAFIPYYNYALVLKIARKNPALCLLFVAGAIVPYIGGILALVGWVIMSVAVGKVFNKSTGFVVGLVLLGIIFYPILGFGSSQYQPDGAGTGPTGGFPVMPPVAPPVMPPQQ